MIYGDASHIPGRTLVDNERESLVQTFSSFPFAKQANSVYVSSPKGGVRDGVA